MELAVFLKKLIVSTLSLPHEGYMQKSGAHLLRTVSQNLANQSIRQARARVTFFACCIMNPVMQRDGSWGRGQFVPSDLSGLEGVATHAQNNLEKFSSQDVASFLVRSWYSRDGAFTRSCTCSRPQMPSASSTEFSAASMLEV